jgi:hypothetical protein
MGAAPSLVLGLASTSRGLRCPQERPRPKGPWPRRGSAFQAR